MSTDRRPVRLSTRRTVVSLLGSLAVAPVFLLCASLYFQTTDFVYGPLSYESNESLVRLIRWSIFGGLTVVLLAIIVWLKTSHPHYGNNPYSLLILLPLLAFVVFSSWIFGIIVFGILIVALLFSQLYVVVVRDELRTPAAGWGKWPDRMATLRFIILAAAAGMGIWLMFTARSWAYRSRQLEEIQRNGLLSQPVSLQQISDGDHKEYVLLASGNLRVDYRADRKFGSGDDSYTLEYGVLTDRTLDRKAILDWKVWVYMPSFYDGKEFPMIFQAARCAVGKDCPANFVTMHDAIIRRYFPDTRYRDEKQGRIARDGQVLVELTPEPDLVLGDKAWWHRISWRASALLLLQAFYSLAHLFELLLIKAKLKAAYPEV
ncbi:MAG: hypothetical protein U1F40_14200 [Turneriella sp.]